MPDSSFRIDSPDCYQRLYNQQPNYGCAETGSCPGVRLLAKYADWLKPPVIDLGSGTGDTVAALLKAGIVAKGVDWIEPKAAADHLLKADITSPIDMDGFCSAICIEVLEHILPEGVQGVLRNMALVQRQAITINNASSVNLVDGKRLELHVNRQPFTAWRAILEEWLLIEKELEIHSHQRLYLCRSKQNADDIP